MKLYGDIRLRMLIAAVFILLVMLPVLFIGTGLRRAFADACQMRMNIAEHDLKKEAKFFQEDLIARLHVEKLIKKAERRAGLSFPTLERPRFASGVDPQIFTEQTIAELMAHYRELAGVEPLMMVAFSADIYNIWSWFSADLDDIEKYDRERVARLLSVIFSEQVEFVPVDATRPDARHRFYEARKLALLDSGGPAQVYFQLMGRLFSDMIYQPHFQGSCYEIATQKRGERRLFFYYRRVKDGPKIMGGYCVLFGGRSFSPEKLLKDSLRPQTEGFRRGYLQRFPVEVGRVIRRKNSLEVESNLPTELIGYNSLLKKKIALPGALIASFDVSAIISESTSRTRQVVFIQQALFLLCLFISTYFILYGFPAVMRLRLRMLLAISLAVLLPYTILAYISLRLLDRIESLGRHELRADSESQMQRLHSYYNDQRQQYLLQTLKMKNRLIAVVDKPEETIMGLPPQAIVGQNPFTEVYFFRDDGVARSFKPREPADTEPPKLEKLLSVKYLENLGCLDSSMPAVKKLQRMTSVADGIMDTVRHEYFDYTVLRYEANETYDLNKFDDFSRMIWFLVPGQSGTGPVRAMASTNVSNLNYVIYNPWEFDPGIFSCFSGRNRHHFIMGQRRYDDMVLRWWPDYISPDHKLKLLLDKTVAERISTGELTGAGGYYRYEKQRFSEQDAMVYSGISSSSPDLLVALLAWLFPFLLLIFALTSLLLFTDALMALFISPVKGIAQAAAAVAGGDYHNRLAIEKTDEFSLLADAFNDMSNGLAQREKMRRFVSENLYDRLGAATGLNEIRSVQSSRVTMLASDIRGFTSLSEQYDPHQIVSLLNDYFTAMETAINGQGGVIERFVGDAVMAVFYSGGEKAAEVRAAAAALEMRRRLVALNHDRSERGLFTIENGVGIATGEASSGIVGREGGRMVFAVIGEVAHRAEILESLTRKVSSKVLVCAETRKLIDDHFLLGSSLESSAGLAFELCDPGTSGGNNG